MVNDIFTPAEPASENFDQMLARLEAEAGITTVSTPPVNGSHAADGFERIGASVFDELADLITWADILEPAGWQQVQPPDAATAEAWKRPGGSHPVSAKVLKANPHVLVVHSEDAGLPVGAGQKLTKARVLAHLHYRGDESAFAKDLIRGNAVGVQVHVNAAFAGEWIEHAAKVSEVSADELSGETGSEVPRSTWRPVDLTSVLDGTWQPPEPSVGSRTDSKGLFYPGKTHTVVSETEAGKTWFALAAAIHEMAAGCHVVYVDFEDDQGSVVGRLLALGVDRAAIAELFHYIRPEEKLEGRHFGELLTTLDTYRPTLAIVDGITEAMTLHGLNPLDNVDIALFNRRVIIPLTTTGAAEVSFDHVTKDKEGRGRYAIGGVHKLNIVSGAGYTLENRQPFGIGLTGRSTIKIAKDRPGQLRANAVDKWYADLVLVGHSKTSAEVSIESPQQRVAERKAEPFRPTNLMEKISRYIEGEAADSQNQILKDVSGNRDAKITALKVLKEEGYVTPTKPYESIRPYRASDEK